VEELHWNLLRRRIVVRLRSASEQDVRVSAGTPLRSVRVEDKASAAIEPEGAGCWRVRLPAGRPVSLLCSI
jgi:hypothetical protein